MTHTQDHEYYRKLLRSDPQLQISVELFIRGDLVGHPIPYDFQHLCKAVKAGQKMYRVMRKEEWVYRYIPDDLKFKILAAEIGL